MGPILICLVGCLVAPAIAAAQAGEALPEPLRAGDVARLAHLRRAEIAAARERAGAAAVRPRIVSALPDPMLMVFADHIPFSGMGADASGMFQVDFPLSRVLRHRGLGAQANARREATEVDRARLDVALEAVRAFYMLDERRRTLAILDDQLKLSRQLAEVTRAHYAAGHGNVAEALRVDSEVERLSAERAGVDAEVRAAEAMLNATIARDATLPVPALASALPAAEPPSRAAVIADAVAHRPELAGMRAEQARATAEIAAMRSMYAPMAFVRAGAAYRMTDGAGAMFALGISLPIWRGKLRAGVEEAQHMSAMTIAETEAMRRMIEGEAAAAREQVAAWLARSTALRDKVLQPASQAVSAATASYAAGQTPLVTVLDALRALFDARMQSIMAEVSLGVSWARLERATGRLGGAR
jgi:outer membrane protein, heavy metal efflux system